MAYIVMALDNIVVADAETGQKCVQFLREKNVGVGTFLILDKQRFDDDVIKRGKSADGAPRLFDLVRPADDKFRVAFYYALRDTLVANDLDHAVKIGYDTNGKTKRVVTLQGQLIDSSGTMSGGGNKVAQGAQCPNAMRK